MAQGWRILEARSWHRGFPDERDAEDAGDDGGGPEGFGRRESSRAFGHRARPDAILGFEGSRGNSHRARLDATGIYPDRGIGASPMSGTLRMPGMMEVGRRASADAKARGRSVIGQGPMLHLDSRVRGGFLIEQGSMPQGPPPIVASGLPR